MQLKLELPRRVTLELTNRCNRLCRSCPRHKMNYALGDMNFNLFQKIVEQLPRKTVIVPFFRGEPLLHPQFEDMIRLLQKHPRFRHIQIATNGDFINETTEKALLSCSFVSLSLHKFTQPSGKRRLKFLENAKKNGTETQVSIVESLIPEGMKQEFVDAWLQHADRVRIYVEHSRTGFGDIGKTLGGDFECHKPFEEMTVYWNGKAALCNHDWCNRQPLGDLNKQSVTKVWNSEAYNRVRTLHLAFKRRTVPSCKNCDYWLTSYLKNRMFGELHTN